MIAAAQGSNTAETVVTYGVLITMLVLRRRTQTHPAQQTLVKGERLRPVLITALDPVLSGLFAGPLLWHLAAHSAPHLAAAVAGGAVGVPIGLLRARVMFVRAVPSAQGVVFRRSPMEYGLLSLLLVLRLLEGSIEHFKTGPLTYVVAALVGLAIVESVTRAAGIIVRYRTDARRPSAAPGAGDAPTPAD